MVDRCERQFVQMGRLRNLTTWDEAVRSQQIEKAVFLAAFIVRKLADSYRLSVQMEEAQVPVDVFSILSAELMPDSWSWDQLDRFYDMALSERQRVPLRHLVNWIIHSYVFIPEVRSDHAGSEIVTGFFCNSDRLRGERLVRVSWLDFRRVLRAVAEDEVIQMVTVRDGRGREVQLRSSEPIKAGDVAAFYDRHAEFVDEVRDRPPVE
jgi:hypothetical protein